MWVYEAMSCDAWSICSPFRPHGHSQHLKAANKSILSLFFSFHSQLQFLLVWNHSRHHVPLSLVDDLIFWCILEALLRPKKALIVSYRVAEVVRRNEKLELGRKFKQYNTLYWCDNKICHDLSTFWKTWGEYYTELNWKICNYAQKRRICRENSEYAPDKYFWGHFCPGQKAANFCHPVVI